MSIQVYDGDGQTPIEFAAKERKQQIERGLKAIQETAELLVALAENRGYSAARNYLMTCGVLVQKAIDSCSRRYSDVEHKLLVKAVGEMEETVRLNAKVLYELPAREEALNAITVAATILTKLTP